MVNGVKNIIVVLSGKGGVGKSTVATQLALNIKSKGFKVGILDVDICGPSVPYLLKLEGHDVHSSSTGAWVPVYADKEKQLAVMSIGFITTDRNSAVIWRGPKKTGMIRQFLSDVLWDGIDFLVIDTPPGTSDEHITLAESLRSALAEVNRCDFDILNPGAKVAKRIIVRDHGRYGAVIVTTPQHVAVEDARRQVTFCKKTGLPLIGIIENMSGFICSHCFDCSYIFSSGGGAALAEIANVPLLGRLPIDPALGDVGNEGHSLLTYAPHSQASKALSDVVDALLSLTPLDAS